MFIGIVNWVELFGGEREERQSKRSDRLPPKFRHRQMLLYNMRQTQFFLMLPTTVITSNQIKYSL